MKTKLIFPLITFIVTSCTPKSFVLGSKVFCFDTVVSIELYEGKDEDVKNIEEILKYYDKLSDNYLSRDITNVYTINNTNETIEVSKDLYDLLKSSMEVTSKGANYFNLLAGSLSKRWKESLSQNQVLSQNEINEELDKLNDSSLSGFWYC